MEVIDEVVEVIFEVAEEDAVVVVAAVVVVVVAVAVVEEDMEVVDAGNRPSGAFGISPEDELLAVRNQSRNDFSEHIGQIFGSKLSWT